MALSSKYVREQAYILVWPGDKPERIPGWGGESVLMPPCNEVAVAYNEKDKTTWNSPYRFDSARGRDGQFIPGTVVLKDVIVPNPATGGLDVLLNAREWCEGVEQNNKALFDRGFTIVMDPDQVEDAMKDGRPKWELAQERAWEDTIREELARQKKFEEKHGQPAPASSSDGAVKEAIAGLAALRARKAQNATSKADLIAALGGPQAEAPKKHVLEIKPSEDDLFMVARELKKAAEAHGIYLKNEELKGLLEADPGVMEAISQKLEAKGVAVGV